MKARRWLKLKTFGGKVIKFVVKPIHGGIAGSLVGLDYIRKDDDLYTLTQSGSRWIGVEPDQGCPS